MAIADFVRNSGNAGSVFGNRATLAGLNLIGLRRKNVDKKEIKALKDFYNEIFEYNELNFKDRLKMINIRFKNYILVNKIIDFLKED